MLKKDDLFVYLLVSIFLHAVVFYFISHVRYNVKKPIFLSAPIEVSFYSSYGQKGDQSTEGFSQGTLKLQPSAKEQMKGEFIAKSDVIVKRRETSRRKLQKPSKQSEKNLEKRPAENKTKSLKSAGNSSSVKTIQLQSLVKVAGMVGSPYEGLSFYAENFKYSYYPPQIIKKIGREWRWSESYGKCMVLVYFEIRRDGTVYDIAIKKSSGNSEYDKNAIDAICRALPFPDLPEGYEDESLGVFFEFKYGD